MDQLKAILTTACLLSLTIGLCNVLKPGVIFEKQIRFIISLIFVLGLVSPILSLKSDGVCVTFAKSSGEVNAQSLTEQMYDEILIITEDKTETALLELLSSNGVECEDLQIQAHIDEGQCIYISEVSVVCDEPQRTCEILRESLGEEVVLHVSQMDTEIPK